MSSSLRFRRSASIIGASFSTTFVAAKRGLTPICWAWSSIRCVMAWMHRCTAPEQKSTRLGTRRSCTARSAVRTSSSMPSFFAALMGTTGMPSSSLSARTFTEPPLVRTSSIMFSASTIGSPSSISCSVR